ncbi:hypothetical protein PUN28_015069 [Cardiocondyla obscurior]|uniref:Uncharacterized protein n=1 Tax=Cardiocondyla obscurior TaxID=286306 RepID=A0AAW2EWY3_9HYME
MREKADRLCDFFFCECITFNFRFLSSVVQNGAPGVLEARDGRGAAGGSEGGEDGSGGGGAFRPGNLGPDDTAPAKGGLVGGCDESSASYERNVGEGQLRLREKGAAERIFSRRHAKFDFRLYKID